MQRLVHTIRQIARHEASQRLHAALGVVTSVFHQEDYACTVKLRESGMVLPRVPIATGLMGTVALPRENDLVVVLFLGGDIHAPVVAGRLYHQDLAPPSHEPGELVASLPAGEDGAKSLALRIQTPGDGSRTLTLTLDGNVTIELRVDDEGIRLRAQDAQLTLTQTSSSDGKAELAVAGSRVTIEHGGDVSISAAGALKITAKRIEISADTEVKVGGQMVTLN